MPVIVLGLLGTTLAALALRRADERAVDRALTQQTTIVQQVVASEIRRYSTSLLDLAAAVGAQAVLEAAEFTAITAATDRQRLPGATGVSFVVATSTEGIPEVQRAWRERGSPQLSLDAATTPADEHLFLILSRPIDGTTPVTGRDLSAAPAAAGALRQARDSHQVTISTAYHLLKDAALPPAQQQLGFVLAAPVYATSPSARDAGRFRGWLVMGLRGTDFLNEAISQTASDQVAVTLADATAQVARWTPDVKLDADQPTRTVAVAVPQRHWQLTVAATERLLPSADLHLDVIAWVVGGCLTALLAALTGTVLTARNRALRRVDDATAALREDITRRMVVEEQLRQREIELVGFAGIVAHDLRSPLARITGYADFLREEAAPTLDPVHRDFLERLYGGARRMQSLIDDLLDYATADNRVLSTAEVDLNQLVAEVVLDRVSGDGDQRPRVVLWPLPSVDGDPVLLRQVIDNLIGNAIKYTPPGADPSVEITSSPQDSGGWRIEVADRGIGIPEDQRDTIFTAFTRAGGSEGYPGTGLGLAIVHRIIERHGGEVGVGPNPGGGSVFWFTLPGTRPRAPAPALHRARRGE